MEVNKNTITNVYIDGANLSKGMGSLGFEIDYEKLILWLKKKYKVSDVYLFLGFLKERKEFYDELSNVGYKIIFKEASFIDGVLKANVDVDLAFNLTKDSVEKKFHKVILVSGDGDFACIVDYLIKENYFHRIIAPTKKKCSYLLRKRTNKIIYAEEIVEVFCVQKEKAPDRDVPLSGSFS